jgi:hypothetical protein
VNGIDRSLLEQLSAINENLCSAVNATTGLLLMTANGSDISGLHADDLRTVGRRLIASGGDLIRLGVEMGVVANRFD